MFCRKRTKSSWETYSLHFMTSQDRLKTGPVKHQSKSTLCSVLFTCVSFSLASVCLSLSGSGKYMFCILVTNRFRQYVAGLTLEASSEKDKVSWEEGIFMLGWTRGVHCRNAVCNFLC